MTAHNLTITFNDKHGNRSTLTTDVKVTTSGHLALALGPEAAMRQISMEGIWVADGEYWIPAAQLISIELTKNVKASTPHTFTT